MSQLNKSSQRNQTTWKNVGFIVEACTVVTATLCNPSGATNLDSIEGTV